MFLKNYVGENPNEFRVRWRKAVFTGKGSKLKELSSEAALLQYAQATPGAIGYIRHVNAEDSADHVEKIALSAPPFPDRYGIRVKATWTCVSTSTGIAFSK